MGLFRSRPTNADRNRPTDADRDGAAMYAQDAQLDRSQGDYETSRRIRGKAIRAAHGLPSHDRSDIDQVREDNENGTA